MIMAMLMMKNMLKKKTLIRTAIETISYLETGQIVVFESGRLQAQQNLVQRRQSVVLPMRFSINLSRNVTSIA